MAEHPRKRRRVTRPGAPGSDPQPQEGLDPVRAREDRDAAWGDREPSNDDRLRRDVPPHWGKR